MKLVEALAETGATIAFDATGGGRLGSDILTCMEAAAARSMGEYSRYGSDVYKQLYIYGGLDRSPTTLSRNFGFAWGVGGFLKLGGGGQVVMQAVIWCAGASGPPGPLGSDVTEL